MIVKMTKYTFVILETQKEDFLGRLQDLGMVDVTSTGWEPTENDRTLMALAEKHRAAVEYLRALADSKEFTLKGKPFGTGVEAFDRYEAARHGIAEIEAEIARYGKLLEETAPLGDFTAQRLQHNLLIIKRYRKIEVAITAQLLTKRNVYIDAFQ